MNTEGTKNPSIPDNNQKSVLDPNERYIPPVSLERTDEQRSRQSTYYPPKKTPKGVA